MNACKTFSLLLLLVSSCMLWAQGFENNDFYADGSGHLLSRQNYVLDVFYDFRSDRLEIVNLKSPDESKQDLSELQVRMVNGELVVTFQLNHRNGHKIQETGLIYEQAMFDVDLYIYKPSDFARPVQVALQPLQKIKTDTSITVVDLLSTLKQTQGELQITISVTRDQMFNKPVYCFELEPMKTAPYVGGAIVGVALGVLATVYAVQSADKYDDYENARPEDSEQLYEEANQLQKTARTFGICAGAVLVADGALFMVQLNKRKKQKKIQELYCSGNSIGQLYLGPHVRSRNYTFQTNEIGLTLCYSF